MDKNISRLAAQGYYNFQLVRLNFLNQIRDIIRKINEGIAFDAVEEKKEGKKFDAKYSDGKLMALLEQLEKDKKIDKSTSQFLEDCLITVQGGSVRETIQCTHCDGWFDIPSKLMGIKGVENEYKKLMAKGVKKETIFIEFLDKIRGIGAVHSANLIKAFGDCGTYERLSKLRAHAGYSVREDNRAPFREKGKEIHYNPKIRTMVWKISDNLMKQNKGFYRKIYDEHKKKQLDREFEEGFLAETYRGYKKEDTKLSKGHAHNRALRKMMVLFLSHFWEASRELNGYPAEKTYVEGVLNHEHIIHWKDVLKMENTIK